MSNKTVSKSKNDKKITIYDADTIDEMKMRIEDIKAEAQKRVQQKESSEWPEKRRIIEIIRQFIKRNRRPVNGGTALQEITLHKDPSLAIYDADGEPADIDFYSPRPILDVITLSNEFHKAGFSDIYAFEALHSETYTIRVKGWRCCDVSYMESKIYDQVCQCGLLINGYKVTHPHFMMIDYYRAMNDPMQSYFRLEKVFSRFTLLQKLSPFHIPSSSLNNDIENDDVPILNSFILMPLLKEFAHQNNNIVIIGEIATAFYLSLKKESSKSASKYEKSSLFLDKLDIKKTKNNYYPVTSKKNIKNKDDVNTFSLNYPDRIIQDNALKSTLYPFPIFEFVSENFKKHCQQIWSILSSMNFGLNKLTYSEYRPFFDFTGRRGEFYLGNRCIVRILDHRERCVPFKKIKLTKDLEVNMATFPVTIMFSLMMRFQNGIFQSYKNKQEGQKVHNKYDQNIIELYQSRNTFLKANNKSIFDETPFQEFVLDCIGCFTALQTHKDDVVKWKKKQGKSTGHFKYEPTKPTSAFDNEQYCNTSGNIIKNLKDQWFFPRS